MDDHQFDTLLGRAAIRVWADLSREDQELLFRAAVDDSVIGNSLAIFLHDRHPRTLHPPKPSSTATC